MDMAKEDFKDGGSALSLVMKREEVPELKRNPRGHVSEWAVVKPLTSKESTDWPLGRGGKRGCLRT